MHVLHVFLKIKVPLTVNIIPQFLICSILAYESSI